MDVMFGKITINSK